MLPGPGLAKDNSLAPGRAASAINSSTFWAGRSLRAISTMGALTICATRRKSSGLYLTVDSAMGAMMSSSGLPSVSWWPSAGDWSSFCTPSAPPTPPMFSMTKVWPSAFCMSGWI